MAFVVDSKGMILFSIPFHYLLLSGFLASVIYFHHFHVRITVSPIALKLITNLSRNISNYFLSFFQVPVPLAFALAHPKLTQIYIFQLSIVYVSTNREIDSAQFPSTAFYPPVKLNGNYFSLTIQHRRKFIMVL